MTEVGKYGMQTKQQVVCMGSDKDDGELQLRMWTEMHSDSAEPSLAEVNVHSRGEEPSFTCCLIIEQYSQRELIALHSMCYLRS